MHCALRQDFEGSKSVLACPPGFKQILARPAAVIVCNCHFSLLMLQDEGAMVAIFWTGLAVWLLFTIAPLRMVLGLVPRRRR